jgi:hypothetical protein
MRARAQEDVSSGVSLSVNRMVDQLPLGALRDRVASSVVLVRPIKVRRGLVCEMTWELGEPRGGHGLGLIARYKYNGRSGSASEVSPPSGVMDPGNGPSALE